MPPPTLFLPLPNVPPFPSPFHMETKAKELLQTQAQPQLHSESSSKSAHRAKSLEYVLTKGEMCHLSI